MSWISVRLWGFWGSEGVFRPLVFWKAQMESGKNARLTLIKLLKRV
jgi:hypothetical protein